MFLIGAYLIRLNFQEKPPFIPKNQQLTFVATIATQPRLSARNQIIKVGDSFLFVPYYPRYKVGDKLKVEGFVDADGRIFNAKVEKIGEKAGVWLFLARWRQVIAENIDKTLPSDEAALVKGMVLGVDEIGRDFREALIATGTIHVVVVSGQNLSIVAGLFLGLINVLGRRLSLVLATAAVFAYALLTGFEPPVVRASLMVLTAAVAVFLGRQSLPILNLTLAAILILFIWPQALLEISFQLTFAATLGIMTLGQYLSKISKLKSQMANLLVNNAAVATSAFIFTAPVIYYHFDRVALISPLVNVLVAELVVPVMILGFLIAGAGLIFMPLAQFLAYLVYVPALVFVKLVEVFSGQ